MAQDEARQIAAHPGLRDGVLAGGAPRLGAPGLRLALIVAAAVSVPLVIAGMAIPGTLRLTWFVPAIDMLKVTSLAVAASLAYLDQRLRDDRRTQPITVVATAGAVVWLAHLVMFPGVFPQLRGELVSDTTAWTYVLAAFALPLGLSLSLVLRAQGSGAAMSARRAVGAGLIVGAVLVGAALLLGRGPWVAIRNDSFTEVRRVAEAFALASALGGLALLRLGYAGDPRVISGVAAALVFAVAASVGLVLLTDRYTADWYAQHLLIALSVLALLGGQLQLYRGSVQSELASAERERGALGLAERQVDKLAALLNVASSLTATLDRESVIARASTALLDGLNAFHTRSYLSASILRMEGSAVVSEGVAGAAPTIDPVSITVAEHPAVARAIATGRAAWCRRDEIDPDVRPAGPGGAVICAPVRSEGRLYGVIGAASTDDTPFLDAELSLAQGVADIVGLALGNADRFDVAAREAARLAALEKVKTDFLRVASHELGGPLAVVRGYVAMAEEGSFGKVPPQLEAPLFAVGRKATEMASLVQQLVEAARLEDSRAALDLADLDLRAAVKEAVARVESRDLPRHRISMITPDREVLVRCDGARVVTLVQNLVDNAVKYSPAGGHVGIRVDAHDHEATVTVEDEGIGIAPDEMDRLFTRFGRIVKPETASIPGTGMGLYLVREIARMHGGDVVVESRPRSGSSFTLRLPALLGAPVSAGRT